MSTKYAPKDLVWAKMRGFPAWPAQVAQHISNTKKKNCCWIFFFGTENYAWVETSQIKPYDEYNDKLRGGSKLASFKQALEKLDDYLEKKKIDPTYELKLPVKKTKDTDDEQTPKKPKKAVKRISKETPKGIGGSAKKQRRSSHSVEENGSHAVTSDEVSIIGAPGDSEASPELDLNNLNDTARENDRAPSSLAFGFMGLGIMGSGIVKNLIISGHRVNLWNRSVEKCEEIKENFTSGLVEIYDTPYEVVLNSDVIFSCVADGTAASTILFGKFGILTVETLEGKGYIEMTGIDPDTSMDYAKAINNKGGKYLEAQLQGSKREAEDGNLVVLTAGDHSLFQSCQECFKAIGKTAFYLGKVGYATKMNMVINLVNSISMLGLTEAFSLAERSGLAIKTVLEIFNVTNMACPYLQRKADRIVRRDFDNPEHALQLMQKDVKLCLDLSNNLKQPLMMASTANEVLKQARRLGYDGQDCSCVFMRSKF